MIRIALTALLAVSWVVGTAEMAFPRSAQHAAASETMSVGCHAGETREVRLRVTLGQLEKTMPIPLTLDGRCRISIHSPAMPLPMEDTRFSLKLLAPGGKTADEAVFGGNTSRDVGFLQASPGKGQSLSFGLDYNTWPVPEVPAKELDRSYEFVLKATAQRWGAPAQGIDRWLRTAGLADEIQVVDVCEIADTSDQGCSRFAEEALSVATMRHRADPSSGIDASTLTESEIAALLSRGDKELVRMGLPTHVLVLRPLMDREKLDALELAYEQETGIEIWDILFTKISSLTAEPARNFMISADVWCASRLLFRVSPGKTASIGSMCMSASAAAALPNLSGGTVAGLSVSVISSGHSLDMLMSEIVDQEFGPTASITYLDRSSDYAELVVRNIKGTVVPGGSYWERLQFNFWISSISQDEARLRIVGDGSIAAGLGAYPPDTQFTEDIEVNYAQNLHDFVRCIAASASRFSGGHSYDRCHK